MVSTRGGIKLKFYEGERVLCYEPDPTKAKVLYDSKVLDVVITKDHRGRKNVEYLIHFQGWNSSWDRCVREEYVLKDTAENRQLQKDLAEKSQLHIGAYLYRKERKKHNRKSSEPIAHSSDDGSLGSPAQLDTEESSHSSEDSSLDDDSVPIELSQDLRNILEHDYHNVNNRNKLMKLPADPNVVAILEMYWKHYATSLLCGLNAKPHTRHRTPSKIRPDDVQKNLNLCKEMLDGLRIYFDFTIKDLLLYKKEQNQVETALANSTIKQEMQVFLKINLEYAHLPNVDVDDDVYHNHVENNHFSNNGQRILKRRRGLRSARNSDTHTNGTIHEPPANVKPTMSVNKTPGNTSASMAKFLSWKLLPDHIYHQQPLPPSLVYGATHLLRLLVKLPELLNVCTMAENKLKVLHRHLDAFIDFLNHHKEWYGDKFYIE
ncbi:hypothetical protein RN001_005061 [Aquatica leii]|uniref:Protein male-specific lethal-3 n=1 Tax=Aquatica leii TaxID=1421715 RepID=A0AAN7PBG9_9COLE|nr:hypothetical protein RN001_005061 [Aquatica leii]